MLRWQIAWFRAQPSGFWGCESLEVLHLSLPVAAGAGGGRTACSDAEQSCAWAGSSPDAGDWPTLHLFANSFQYSSSIPVSVLGLFL